MARVSSKNVFNGGADFVGRDRDDSIEERTAEAMRFLSHLATATPSTNKPT